MRGREQNPHVGSRAAAAIAALTLIGGFAVRGTAAPKQEHSNAQAVSGTWALQQVASVKELDRLRPAIDTALETPQLRGFCLRAPWKAIDRDFALLEAGLKIARQHRVAYSVRFMAGRHTPGRVFDGAGSPFSLRAGEKVPMPFNSIGAPNLVFEAEYEKLVQSLAKWCRANEVRLLHLAWYGRDWAELNHGKEVRAQPGYSYANWLKGHQRLVDIGLRHAGPDLAVEFPFSGHGPLTQAAVDLADYVVAKAGPANPIFFCQANGWGPNGDWGAPNHETEAAFDRVWKKPICRGQQAIQPSDYDWTALFRMLRENRATYCEVYVPSFTKPRRDSLVQEIGRFAAYCASNPPLPAAPDSTFPRLHPATSKSPAKP